MSSFAPSFECLDAGVGDDEHSWAWDGVRKIFIHDHKTTSEDTISWIEGDTLGLLCDFTVDEMLLFKNGVKLHSYSLKSQSRAAPDIVFAAITGKSSSFKLNFGTKESFKFPPSQISSSQSPCFAMFRAREEMNALLSGRDEKRIKVALGGLIQCVQNCEGKQRLFVERFGVKCLVELLKMASPGVGVVKSVSCRSGHSCQLHTYANLRSCDLCKCDIPVRSDGLRCGVCNFDVCAECSGNRSLLSIQAVVCRVIAALSDQCKANRLAFHDEGAVTALTALLRFSAEELLISTCAAIGAICTNEARNQDAFGSAGIICSLCSLLRAASPPVQESCAGALAQLVQGHQRNQDDFRGCGGNPVVASLISSASAGLKNQLCKLVEYLSADNAANATSLTAAGAVASLSSSSAPQKHVMFSYCWAPEAKPEHVRLLASSLPALCGVEAWTDVTGSSFVGKMAGSTDAIMAAAVEASSHVVVCVSREYKNSANCQQEATYARQFEKKGKLKIIYVMMQSDFTTVSQPDSVDGWLGIMVGNSLWCGSFNYTRIYSEFMLQLIEVCICC
jgi:hypothetical protein